MMQVLLAVLTISSFDSTACCIMVCPKWMLDTFNFGLLVLLWKTAPDATGLHRMGDNTEVSSSVHITG